MEQAPVSLGGDARVEENDVKIPRLRLDARVDKVLERLYVVAESCRRRRVHRRRAVVRAQQGGAK